MVDWAELDIAGLMVLEGAGPNVFVGRRNEENGSGRIFGGQILGQSLVAVARTVPPDRPIHSMHLIFCASGRPDLPVRYTVEVLSDSPNTSVRSVRAEQGRRVVCVATVSCRAPGVAFDHDGALACEVPGPLMHADAAALVESDPTGLAGHPLDFIARKGSIELRIADVARHGAEWSARRDGRPFHVWVRSPRALSDDQLLHQCAVAYLTDYVLAHVPPLQVMPYPTTKRMLAASVNHALWFYRPLRADQWLLLEISCPVAAAGRGLSTAKVYDGERHVVAVTTQECVYRDSGPPAVSWTSRQEIRPGTGA